MKTTIAILLAVAASFAPGAVIQAASGTPEVDKANATLSMSGRLVQTTCTGEDAKSYVTYKGKWIGTQTETTPGTTDYALGGILQVTNIVWNINVSTKRGVLSGTVKLASSTGTPTYSGKLKLITQGTLVTGGPPVLGRGFILAGLVPADDAGAPPRDDSLAANVVWKIDPNFSATAAFGDSPAFASVPNFSAVTNVLPKALDGVC